MTTTADPCVHKSRRNALNKTFSLLPRIEEPDILIPARGLFSQLIRPRRYIVCAHVKYPAENHYIHIHTVPYLRIGPEASDYTMTSFFSELGQCSAGYYRSFSTQNRSIVDWRWEQHNEGLRVVHIHTAAHQMFMDVNESSHTPIVMNIEGHNAIAIIKEDPRFPPEIDINILAVEEKGYNAWLRRFIIRLFRKDNAHLPIKITGEAWSRQIYKDRLFLILEWDEGHEEQAGFFVLNLPAIVHAKAGDKDKDTKIKSVTFGARDPTDGRTTDTTTIEVEVGSEDSEYAKWWFIDKSRNPFSCATLVAFDYDDALAEVFWPDIANHLTPDVADEVTSMLVRMPTMPH